MISFYKSYIFESTLPEGSEVLGFEVLRFDRTIINSTWMIS